ncbi:unnamed protein product [Danaus chrysippus]|uniref:(African queen) hypothetical protein n=1 Tax=Danaus chrysippus TaxID=151541 RepID=A0A8J2QWG5_9NEOP|nr:unnamed protein product [Danaus chrysippus]
MGRLARKMFERADCSHLKHLANIAPLPHQDTTLLRRRRLKRPARELIPAPSSGAAESPVPTAAEQDQPPPSRRRLEGSHPAGVSRAVISQ